MVINIQRLDNLLNIVITTPHNEPDKLVEPEYEPLDVYTLNALSMSQGYYGHTLGDPYNTTNLDLYAACLNLEGYEMVEVTPIPKANKVLMPLLT
jgi:hypothetical protein